MAASNTRHRAIALYKELHRLGRDYPDPSYDFHGKLRRMYEKNRNLTNPEDIERALQFGEFIRNETLALIKLSKYRHLKRTYSSFDGQPSNESRQHVHAEVPKASSS